MIFIINTLGPIIILVVLGILLRAKEFAKEDFFKQTNKLLYWIGLPALLFSKSAALGGIDDIAMKIFLALAATMLGATAVGYIISYFLKVPSRSMGAFVQGGFRSNLAFVGLPVVFFALDGIDATDADQGRAIMAIMPLMICYNLLAIPILLAGQKQVEGSMGRRIIASLKKVGSNPIIISAVVGLAFGSLGLQIPVMFDRVIKVIAGLAMPLALMGVGATLVFERVRPVVLYAAGSALLKVMISPLLCYFICGFFGLSGTERLIAMLFAAAPTAAVSYVMTEQLGGDGDLAAGIIVLSAILSPLSLGIILAIS